MDKTLEKPLREFVEAYATQKTENADSLIHEYITRKAQTILFGEAEEAEEEKKDDEKKDEEGDKKDDEKKDDDKKSDEEESDDDEEKKED